MRKNSNLNEDDYDAMALAGTVIVGSYTETGAPKAPAKILGSKEVVDRLSQQAANTFTQNGGVPQNAPKTENMPPVYVETPFPAKTKTVVFNTQIGKIRLNTAGVLICEYAVCLIVHRDELKYEPSVGYSCELVVDDQPYSVAYFGFKFAWPESNNILLIFVINQEKEANEPE